MIDNLQGWNWKSLLQASALLSLAISIFGIVAFEPEIPIVTGVLMSIGLLWMRRPGKAGVIYSGLLHLLIALVVLFLFQNIRELAYPASWMVFLSAGARLIATGTAMVGAIGAILTTSRQGAPRVIGALALTLLLVLIAVGIVSRFSVKEDFRQPGDVVLRITPETKWSTSDLRVNGGTISIYVRNDDVHQGTFTIDGVVNLEVPAGTSKRATFDLGPGQYRFYSKLYPEESAMRGTLFVS